MSIDIRRIIQILALAGFVGGLVRHATLIILSIQTPEVFVSSHHPLHELDDYFYVLTGAYWEWLETLSNSTFSAWQVQYMTMTKSSLLLTASSFLRAESDEFTRRVVTVQVALQVLLVVATLLLLLFVENSAPAGLFPENTLLFTLLMGAFIACPGTASLMVLNDDPRSNALKIAAIPFILLGFLVLAETLADLLD